MASLYFMPNQAQLDCLSLASPFASQIYQKHSDDAQAFWENMVLSEACQA